MAGKKSPAIFLFIASCRLPSHQSSFAIQYDLSELQRSLTVLNWLPGRMTKVFVATPAVLPLGVSPPRGKLGISLEWNTGTTP
jgi:hypothetical protein